MNKNIHTNLSRLNNHCPYYAGAVILVANTEYTYDHTKIKPLIIAKVSLKYS